MNFIESINHQYELYKEGMLTHGEMLDNIVDLVNNERFYVIEYKKGKKWKLFTDTLYTLTEVKEEIEHIANNDLSIIFRYRAA